MVKNAPAIRALPATTAAMPGRATNVPAGTRRRNASASTAAAASATTRPISVVCWPDQLSALTPKAAAKAAATRPGRAAGGSVGVGSPRLAGSTRRSATTTSGTSPRNTQCHESCSVTSAEIGGPTSEGTTQAADISPKTAGRARGV